MVNPAMPGFPPAQSPVAVAVPASAAASGIPGQYAYASGFFYICIALNTWQRVAIATF